MVFFNVMEESIDEVNEIKVNDDPSYDDLLCILKEMHEDIQLLLKINNILKNERSSLSERINLCDENDN